MKEMTKRSARVAFGCAFAALIAYEWGRWPNGSTSVLLGPVGIIWYGGRSCGDLLLCGISAVLVLAVAMKPHPITAVVSFFGTLNWLFWGVVAKGIGC